MLWFLMGILLCVATALKYTKPSDITPEEWKLIYEADTQTCVDLSLDEISVRSAWDARVTERAAAIGYTDAHLGSLISSDGNCGPECIALGNALDEQQQAPGSWNEEHAAMASSVRMHTSHFLRNNRNTHVSSMGIPIRDLHFRIEEPFDDFARRMGRPNEYIEMPFFAAAAIVYNRPIVVVSGHGNDPQGGYFIFSPGSQSTCPICSICGGW
jgi:hypothetical protein